MGLERVVGFTRMRHFRGIGLDMVQHAWCEVDIQVPVLRTNLNSLLKGELGLQDYNAEPAL